MYHAMTLDLIKHDEMAKDLNLPIEHISQYFSNYTLYKNFPIRDLTFEEENLVKAIQQVKIMTDAQLKYAIQEYSIDLNLLKDDQLLIERKISKYDNEERYLITRKYQKFILEPAVLYGNTEAPLTKSLSMNDVMLLLSHIAMGVSKNKEEIDARTRIAALSKIADIYATSKMLQNQSQDIDPTMLTNLSPTELTKIIDFIKTNQSIPMQNKEDIKIEKEIKSKKKKDE
jgi:hypothetical protein